MKKTLLTFFIFSTYFFSYAQKELWGNNQTQSYIDYSNPSNPVTVPYYGSIVKYDINGDNPNIVYTFDGINGKLPTGKLCQASNGKLYGLTSAYSSYTGVDNDVCLFEYDLILSKFRILHTFPYTIFYSQYMTAGVMEGLPGKLYGTIGTKFFCYTIATETVTTHTFNTVYSNLKTEFIQASDGNLYGCGYWTNGSCNGSYPGYSNGIIYKINPNTNIAEIKFVFPCSPIYGTQPSGGLIEISPNILLGSAAGGGDIDSINNTGTLFEYNITTNIFTKKLQFNGVNVGTEPYNMIPSTNGKLYGVCARGGTTVVPPNSFFNYSGSIFEYTPATNVITQLYNCNLPPFTGISPNSIMRASTGMYFCQDYNGILARYNSTENTFVQSVTPCANCQLPAFANQPVIEICRKPAYEEILVNTFNPCVGENFTFNILNTNATSYIWKKNNIDLPTQTTGILNLASVSTNDNGTYTCQMVNECGTTVTMPFQLTVDCLGTNDFITLDKSITLFPNPTNNILNIKIYENSNIDISKITITNLLGQIVLSEEKYNSKIDVSKFETGVYQIKLITNKGNWNKKFIKK